ncbi:MAG: glycosyltransferase family 4 protein [Thermoanaerobaculales bacterium]
MRIGVDGKSLLQPHGGVGRYINGLLAGCEAVPHPDIDLEVLTPTRPRRTLPWVLFDLQRATGHGFGLFHLPFYYPPLWPRCPFTVAIHDVLVLEHPEWFPRAWGSPLRRLMPRGARRASAVMTGSPSVAAAIVERCRVAPEKIHITGYGVDHRRFVPPAPDTADAVRADLNLKRPFVLQLGALEPRRGVDLAIAAVRALRRRLPDLELILVGDIRAPVADLDHAPGWVRRIGGVDDAILPALFAAAEAILAPSRGEGFDLPVLEALACGAVVVASDIPVHREHFAAAVELFASGNAEALTVAITSVLEDSARALALRTAGPRVAAAFTWEEVARRHLELWREVGHG